MEVVDVSIAYAALDRSGWGSVEGGAMMIAHLRLAPVFIIGARWSINIDVISIVSCILYTAMIFDK